MTRGHPVSISKWGYGSPVSWASFLSIFSFLSRLRVRHERERQTDRQTTAVNA